MHNFGSLVIPLEVIRETGALLVDEVFECFLRHANRATDVDGLQFPFDSHAVNLAFAKAEAFCRLLDCQ